MHFIRVFGTAALSLLAVIALTAPTSAAQELRGTHGGNAYGTWANSTAGPIATQLGRSAFEPCPCNGTDGQVRRTSAENVASGQTARTNRIASTAQADKTATTAYTLMTSKADTTSLLNGRITADLIKAVALTDATSSRMHSTAKDSRFGNLRVLGTPVNDIAPNTVRQIPGFGRVVLREVRRSGDGFHRSAIDVNMIHLFITQANSMHIPVGSEIVIGHAHSGYRARESNAFFSGYAFATAGQSNSSKANNRTGRSAAIYLGCAGSNNVPYTNNINRSSVAKGLSAGSGETSVRGGFSGSTATAVAKSTVSNVLLLGGLVKADEVRGVARATWDRTTDSGSNDFTGSQFIGLRVNGKSVSRNVAPNTRMNLPGVGYVLLNHQVARSTPDSANSSVAMIEIHFTTPNQANMPAGSTFLVGVAASGVAPN